jgi:uncharacterized protein YndB with AHSA1/START domain
MNRRSNGPDVHRAFTIIREFDAPREPVFLAWTEPEHAGRWFGPRGCATPRSSIEMDVRPGGTWRATMTRDDGHEFPTGGFYLEVRPPERLVFTWRDPGGAAESVVTVDLVDLGGSRTGMTFHQAGFTTEEARRGVHDGWSSSFDRLAEHIADPEGEMHR